MSNLPKTVGQQAQEFREAMGWNSTRMAAEVSRHSAERKVTRQNIEGLEAKGNRKPHFIAALAATLGTTVDALYAGTYSVGPKVGGHLAGGASYALPPPVEGLAVREPAPPAIFTLDNPIAKGIGAPPAGLRGKGQNEPEIVIPQYEAGGGMGASRLLLAEQPGLIKSWHVDHEWIRQNVKHYTSLNNLCIVTGFGPSMKPLFNPGDPLLVDIGVQAVDHDAIFFFRIGEEGYIKQLQRIPDPNGLGRVFRAKSKNPDYDPFDIHPDNPHFKVLGKVLTVWRSEQF